MKRKRSAALSLMGPRLDAAVAALFSVLLFFAMNLWVEWFAVAAAFLCLALCLGRTPWRLGRERLCVPVLCFWVFMLLSGLEAIYSPFGGSAVRYFRGMLPAFALAALVLFRLERRHVRPLLWGMAAVSAVLSLLCTSSAAEGPLFRAFVGLMESMGEWMYMGIEQSAGRVSGIYNDANVTGSLFALGSLISLYLVQTADKWWKQLLACVLVSTSALGILLSVSRAAMLCFGLSLLVWLAVVGKERRLRLFLLLLVSAGVCLVTSLPAMPSVGPGSVLANVLAPASGGVIFLLDWGVGERLARRLAGHGKAVAGLCGGVAVAVAVFLAAAFSLTGPFAFNGRGLDRWMGLEPGTYTLALDGDGLGQVHVYSQSVLESLTGTQRTLYSGLPEEVAFTVPEDAERVLFRFYGGTEGSVLRSAVVSDGTEIPLAYKLLPEGIVTRLHRGMFSDVSFLLRVQYMKDAWKLIWQNPLLGYGLGSTDNLYPAIQPFYYTSRYVHNHVLQVMVDGGIVAAAPFAAFLAGALWLLVRRLKEERDPLAALLLACWVMMNSHSMMEINFSLQSYQCMAYVLLLLPVVLYARPLAAGKVKMGGAAVCVGFWAYLAVFGGLMGLRLAVRQESDTLRATSMEELMAAVDSYARRDVFDPAPYQLEYVSTAVADGSGQYDVKMLEYVGNLRNSGSYPACSGLLEHYYLPTGDFAGLFDCALDCLRQRASYASIWDGQMEFFRSEVLPAAGEAHVDVFAEGVLACRALLEEVNQSHMEEIVLAEENRAFVERVAAGTAQGLSGSGLYDYLVSPEIPS